MKQPSLRRRLALTTTALAGSVLVGFALLSSWLIYQAKLDRLDAQLETALVPIGRSRGEALPPNPEAALAQSFGLSSDQAVAILLVDSTGRVRYQSKQWPPALAAQNLAVELPLSPADLSPRSRLGDRRRPDLGATLGPVTRRTAAGSWRLVSRRTPLGQVVIAVNLRAIQGEMVALRRIYLITIPGALLVIAAGAWGLAGRALRPVKALSYTISRVTAQGLHQRVPKAGVDYELEGLITVFNAMLERLERSFSQASRFSGDAAHELKTPLAILQGEIEQAIQQADTGSPIQQTLGQLLEEVSHLSGIVRKLLLLSLADAGQISLHRQPIDLSALVQEQAEDLPLLAPDLRVSLELDPGLTVMGDRDLLVQLIQNLLSNAVKYNRPQGWIRIHAVQTGDWIQITVANAAQPLTPNDQAHLFDRFYRGDPARTRKTDGLGLGLSLAREIAQAHGGQLALGNASGAAVEFCLMLPQGSRGKA